jgi:hypothetical protein
MFLSHPSDWRPAAANPANLKEKAVC